jgi:hypothetical protein
MGGPPTRLHSARRFSLGGEATLSRWVSEPCGWSTWKDDDADQAPVLVVEDMPGTATGEQVA